MAEGRGILKYLRALCFPAKCAACRTLLDWQTPHESDGRVALCDGCMRAWVSETLETCGACARRVGECLCVTPLMRDARIEHFCKLVYYVPHRRRLVQNRVLYTVKRTCDHKTVCFLGEALAVEVRTCLTRLGLSLEEVTVTHLPRTRRAVKQYGVDQAKGLACALAKSLGVAHEVLLMRRRGAERRQKALRAAEREKNARDAYLPVSGAECRNKTVLLVDDIVTTGAGMAACARILRKMGAARVIAVAVASDIVNREISEKVSQND